MPLYKYLPPDPAIVVGNLKLRFTRPSGLNDPFELRPYFESIATEQEIADNFWARFDISAAFDKAYDAMPAAFRNSVSKLEFLKLARGKLAQDRVNVESLIQQQLDKFFSMLPSLSETAREAWSTHLERVGILSLTSDPISIYMWTHYAQSHTGYAIEFDENHAFFNQQRSDKDEFFYLREVSYFDKLPSYESISELDGSKILCVKSAQYALEKEWRMLVPLTKPTSESTIADELIDFPAEAISGVIFGLRATTEFRAQVLQKLDANPGFARVTRKVIVADHKNGALSLKEI